ncbi:MAG: hypothetical protein PHG05_04140 [Candidatus Nanoarchaeia archaeon]|nr:hypothetical protein [Candidatus Nanoarchaeia archaeon]
MSEEGMSKKIGIWAFMGGIIIAIIVGFATAFINMGSSIGVIIAIMSILGLIVGAMNVTEKEVTSFIIAAIGLTTGSMALAGLGSVLPEGIGNIVTTIFSVFGVFVAGAVFIPALKAIYKISKD